MTGNWRQEWVRATLLTVVLVLAAPAAAEAPVVGKELPSFYLSTLNPAKSSVRRVVLDQLVGAEASSPARALVVVFFDADCQPCRHLLPELNKLFARHRNKGLAVVGVDSDAKPEKIASARKMIDDMGITFPVVADRFLALSRRYGIQAYPTLFIADGQGLLRLRQDGFHVEKKPLPTSTIEQLLFAGGKPASTPTPAAGN